MARLDGPDEARSRGFDVDLVGRAADAKGSQGQIRMWVGTFGGDDADRVIVSVEYPNLEALEKGTALMRSHADLCSQDHPGQHLRGTEALRM